VAGSWSAIWGYFFPLLPLNSGRIRNFPVFDGWLVSYGGGGGTIGWLRILGIIILGDVACLVMCRRILTSYRFHPELTEFWLGFPVQPTLNHIMLHVEPLYLFKKAGYLTLLFILFSSIRFTCHICLVPRRYKKISQTSH
jgi:hypothetical protein